MIPDTLLVGDALVEDAPRGPAAERAARLRPPAHLVPLVLFTATAVICMFGTDRAAVMGTLADLGRGVRGIGVSEAERQAKRDAKMLLRRELRTGVEEAAEGLGSIRSKRPAPPARGTIDYVHLWVSEDGETHLADCKMKAHAVKTPSGESERYVGSLTDTVSGLGATNVSFTQQSGPEAWHHSPQAQFVVTLAGTWFVNTTDGDQRYLHPGSWLFQDNSERHPAAMLGTRRAMHYSEAVGPCNQMVVRWKRAPVVGHRCPF